MQARTLILPDRFINMLVNLPESGMSYQIVNIFLKSRKVLDQQKFSIRIINVERKRKHQHQVH